MRQGDAKQYALRITPRIEQDIRIAFEQFIEMSGMGLAQEWRIRLAEQIASLSTNPNRFPLVPEHRHFRREIRHLVFRRNVSSVAYRILFWGGRGRRGRTNGDCIPSSSCVGKANIAQRGSRDSGNGVMMPLCWINYPSVSARGPIWRMVRPPSTTRIRPVTYAAASEAR